MCKPRVQSNAANPISGGDFQAKKANTGIKKNFTATSSNFIKTELKTSENSSNIKLSSTTVSNDGVVINYYKTDSNVADKYIFYLGMNTPNTPTPSGTSDPGLVPCLGQYQNKEGKLEHKAISISHIIAIAAANPSLATYGV